MLHYTLVVDPLSVILLIVLALAVVLAGWLWASRSALGASLEGERGARVSTEKQLEEERESSRRLSASLDAAERALGEAVAEQRVYAERITQMSERHRGDLESAVREAEARSEAERRSLNEAREEFERRSKQRDEEFRRAIQAAAGEALKQSAEHLLKITESKVKDVSDKAGAELDARKAAVEHLVKPIAETLRKTEEKLVEFDKSRASGVAELKEQTGQLARAHEALRKETANLSQALRKPSVRGVYGEVQLRRVVELAGMRDYCDFTEQHTSSDDEGNRLRPDMVVRMPGNRYVVIDAKTNIEPYLEAVEATDDAAREAALEKFALGMSSQVSALSKKSYAERMGGFASSAGGGSGAAGVGPEFVVMFVPGDQFVDAAMSRDPGLIERAAEQRVIIASPSTLIGLLRAVFVGWREERVAERAEELIKLGRELHERVAVVMGHADGLADALNRAVEKYNQFQRSMDTRIMPTLRRFEELDARSTKEVPDPPAIVTVARVNAAVAAGRLLPE
ncbi:MAG: DNA recombination protein RmuC [Phycisphaerales bacterium]